MKAIYSINLRSSLKIYIFCNYIQITEQNVSSFIRSHTCLYLLWTNVLISIQSNWARKLPCETSQRIGKILSPQVCLIFHPYLKTSKIINLTNADFLLLTYETECDSLREALSHPASHLGPTFRPLGPDGLGLPALFLNSSLIMPRSRGMRLLTVKPVLLRRNS